MSQERFNQIMDGGVFIVGALVAGVGLDLLFSWPVMLVEAGAGLMFFARINQRANGGHNEQP